MAPTPHRKRRHGARTALATVGLVAFLAVDITLVGFAIQRAHTGELSSASTGAAQNSPNAAAPATAAPSATAAPAATTPATRIAPVNATTAYRAATGQCAGSGASLQKTTNGGVTWATASPVANVQAIFRLVADNASTVSVIGGTGSACTATGLTSFTSGAAFATRTALVTSDWYLNPSTAASVHSPTGDQASPCASPVDIAAINTTHAAVLCSDHTVYRTSTGGTSWGAASPVLGATSITATATQYRVAGSDQTACAGVQVSSLTAEPTATTVAGVGCATVPSATATSGGSTASPQAAVIAANGDVVWLQMGTSDLVSTDGGVTW